MLKQSNDEPKPMTSEDFDELGVTRFFGRGDIGARNLLSGWAEAEDNHNWNDGPEAALVMTLRQRPEESCLLSVEGRPFLAPGVPRQDVTLFVNGFRVAFWRLGAGETVILEAEIEPEMWLIRRGGALARCAWHLPDSTRPRDISGVQDQRQLGFCFQSMTLWPRRQTGIRR